MVELNRRAVLQRHLDLIAAAPLDRGAHTAAERRARLAPLVVVVLGGRVRSGEGLGVRLVDPVSHLLRRLVIELLHRLQEGLFRLCQRHPVLRAFGARDARLDLAQVQLQRRREERVRAGVAVKHALLAGVGIDQLERLGRAAGQLQVAQRLGVDREDRAGRAELRRHVADRRPVGEAELGQARTEELDELGDDAVLAQHLGHGQDQVSRGRPLGQLAVQLEADHLGQQHRYRLAQHRRLRLDPADTPAEHTEAVDHRRVRVGADQRVGIGLQRAAALGAVDDL